MWLVDYRFARVSPCKDHVHRICAPWSQKAFYICRQSEVEVGSTTLPDEAEDVEDLPLVRRRRVSSAPVDNDEDIEEVDPTPPSSPPPDNNVLHQQQIGSDFPSEVTSFKLRFTSLGSYVYGIFNGRISFPFLVCMQHN